MVIVLTFSWMDHHTTFQSCMHTLKGHILPDLEGNVNLTIMVLYCFLCPDLVTGHAAHSIWSTTGKSSKLNYTLTASGVATPRPTRA